VVVRPAREERQDMREPVDPQAHVVEPLVHPLEALPDHGEFHVHLVAQLPQ
jgi:hypothetical protein